MPTVIVLSSSPPRIFARSPTPARSSSPLPSPNSILKAGLEGRKRFKTAPIQRDGFTAGFTSASAFLRAKPSAENLPIIPTRTGESGTDASLKVKQTGITDAALSAKPAASTHVEPADSLRTNLVGKDNGQRMIATNGTQDEATHDSTYVVVNRQALGKALSRRSDWTPVHSSAPAELDSPTSPTRSFRGGLLGSFGYNAPASQNAVPTQRTEDGEPTKRRRIDLIEKTMPAPPKLSTVAVKAPIGLKKRSKSPAKKAVTITGLATTRYLEEELGQVKVNPMLEYLCSTQAKACDDSEEPAPNTAMPKPKPKRAARKPKKSISRPTVLSPQSALKAIDSQEALFGFASQLARDDSPGVLRDTLRAMKQSESFLSDPVPTQLTQPISIESNTPHSKFGTSRFTRTKNLWAAADRDEDNALVHVDTIDMFDTPTINQAFAGKDVLLAPDVPRPRDSRSPEKRSPSIRGGQLSVLGSRGMSLFDIDDIKTPTACASAARLPLIQARSLHVEAKTRSRVEENTVVVDGGEPGQKLLSDTADVAEAPVQAVQPAGVSKPKPRKPTYEGFATHDLQKQLSAYGFKPIKKREKMIEVLDRCWADKYGDNASPVQATPPAVEDTQNLTHGDFLSNLHGIAARPVPKAKKLPGRKKKKDETAPSVDGETAKSKSPARRKKADGTPVAKVPRKRKSKASELSTEVVVDLDDIDLLAGAAKVTTEAFVSPKTKWTAAIAGAVEGYPKTKASKKASDLPSELIVDLDDISRPEMNETAEGTAPTKKTMTKTGSSKKITKAKVPRKRKPKASAVAEDVIVDLDDIDVSAIKTPKPKKAPAKRKTTKAPTATPPPSAHVHELPTSPPGFTALPFIDRTTTTISTQPPIPTQISLAIRTFRAPPAHDHRRNPTWHEKILLFDPIVLEDLTAWLNGEGLKLIGEQRSVSALEVRAWCEGRGVCCLWKGGWRGNGNGNGAKGGKKGEEGERD